MQKITVNVQILYSSAELVCIELNWLTFTEIMRPKKELRMSEAFLFPSFSRGDSNLDTTLSALFKEEPQRGKAGTGFCVKEFKYTQISGSS